MKELLSLYEPQNQNKDGPEQPVQVLRLYNDTGFSRPQFYQGPVWKFRRDTAKRPKSKQQNGRAPDCKIEN